MLRSDYSSRDAKRRETQKRLEEARLRREAEEQEKANQRYKRKEHKSVFTSRVSNPYPQLDHKCFMTWPSMFKILHGAHIFFEASLKHVECDRLSIQTVCRAIDKGCASPVGQCCSALPSPIGRRCPGRDLVPF